MADTVASRMRVLCLDELFVTNVADAMILERLFGRLWDRGLVLVATSNRRPDTLYEGGLQRQLFMPFVRRLEAECNVHDMASPTDYRRLATRAVGAYFVRLVEGATNDDRLDSAFRQARRRRCPFAVEPHGAHRFTPSRPSLLRENPRAQRPHAGDARSGVQAA